MNWSDYEAAWKRQDLPEVDNADILDLHDTFQDKSRKLAGILLVRDWSEIIASGFVIGFYIFYWGQVGAEGWPMALAIGLVIFIATFFLRERLRCGRIRERAEAPLIKKIEADLLELRYQGRLLNNVLWWYVLPACGAITLHGVVIMRHLPEWNLLNTTPGRLVFGGIVVSLGYLVWWMNRKVVRDQVEPRILELEKLRTSIRSETSNPL
ncbi:MAG: hypothetical protein SynsKO_42140 [Synoicihabitans sp.]